MKFINASILAAFFFSAFSALALNMKDAAVAANIPKCLADESACTVGDSPMHSWRALHKKEGCGYSDVKTPKVTVDDNFVEINQAHRLSTAGNMDQYFTGINDVCAKGEVQKKTVTTKIKSIHFYALKDLPNPKSAFDGPEPVFALKGTELNIGYHWTHENLTAKIRTWLENNL